MKIGIIGYGSMGKMFLWTFYETGVAGTAEELFVKTLEKRRLTAEAAAKIFEE